MGNGKTLSWQEVTIMHFALISQWNVSSFAVHNQFQIFRVAIRWGLRNINHFQNLILCVEVEIWKVERSMCWLEQCLSWLLRHILKNQIRFIFLSSHLWITTIVPQLSKCLTFEAVWGVLTDQLIWIWTKRYNKTHRCIVVHRMARHNHLIDWYYLLHLL